MTFLKRGNTLMLKTQYRLVIKPISTLDFSSISSNTGGDAIQTCEMQ